MIVASRRNIQVILLRKAQDFLSVLPAEPGIEGLYPLQSVRRQALQPAVHVLSLDQLISVSEGRMRQYRDSAACENPCDGLLRFQEFQTDPKLVQVVTHGGFFGFRIAVLHQEVRQMRLSGVVQAEQLLDLFRGKHDSEFPLQEIQPCMDLLHPDPVSLFHQLPHGFRFRIIAISEDVVLSLLIPAGELHTGEKLRIVRFSHLPNHAAALDGVMVRDGKQLDSVFPYTADNFLRRIGTVRNGRMHMQVDSVRFCHTLLPFPGIFGAASALIR